MGTNVLGSGSRTDNAETIERFSPAWWCRGAHAQTIWATLRPVLKVATHRERWDTPDGDFLIVEHVPASPDRPILIVLHGFESSSQTASVRGFLRAAYDEGWRALGMNFRSCGGALNRLRRSYHSGETSDLRWLIQRMAVQYPQAPLCCVGMSLGANVLLKYLGEEHDQAPAALTAAVAISTPFDLAICAQTFERGFFNRLYMRRLLRSLIEKTGAKLRHYPDLVNRQRLEAVRTIREFDELVTAPVHGFTSAAQYWTASSCRPFLPSIRRPTLLINALDDPVVPAHVLPREEIAGNPALFAAFPEAGGHVGFLSGTQPWRPTAWAEQQAIRFFKQQMRIARPMPDR